jgi:hypothetical protein
MKNGLLCLFFGLSSLFCSSQERLHLRINVFAVQKEFMTLYYKRADSLKHEIAEDKSLLCLTQCQLNYLKGVEHISHEQKPGSAHYSLDDRFNFYYPTTSERSNSELDYGEVICQLGGTDILYEYTNKELAYELFNGFITSKGHREIMDNEKFVKVNFQVAITRFNKVVVVGVLSNQTMK